MDTARAMSQENVVRGVRYPISLPSERAGQRRSLDERLYVRFPALYRLLAERWTRLPPRSRLRRLVLRRLTARGAAAVNRRDFEVLFVGFDPGIEYHPAGDQLPPGMDPVSHGHEGYEKVWRQMIDSFEDFHAEPVEYLDFGDQLLATTEYKGHGSGSGVPVTIPLFQLLRLRGGLVVWQRDFNDRSEALEAAARRE
jgi:SnoaL-like domain